ncbi:MAG: hypothetical protein M3203_09370 [Actinomycetota bacterium]|nr:hypothetical protein [Actinomycetota bacterium]
MGFLDRAKKLADQAKTVAEQAREMAEGALTEARSRTGPSGGGSGGVATDPRMGTAYVPGMLGRPGWREKGLTDPAAVLPIADRDRAGVPHTTKSEIVEEPFGMGRRWTAGGRSVGLFYQLYPEHRGWEPPAGRTPLTAIPGWQATLPDGRALAFLGSGDAPVVLETNGLDDAARSDLVYAVLRQLEG